MTDDAKAVYMSLVMGLIEAVNDHEKATAPKGARSRELRKLYDGCDKIIDMYRLVSWPLDKQLTACKVLEDIEALVSKAFAQGSQEN